MGAIKLEAKVLVRCRLTIIDYDNFLEILSGLVRPGIPVGPPVRSPVRECNPTHVQSEDDTAYTDGGGGVERGRGVSIASPVGI